MLEGCHWTAGNMHILKGKMLRIDQTSSRPNPPNLSERDTYIQVTFRSLGKERSLSHKHRWTKCRKIFRHRLGNTNKAASIKLKLHSVDTLGLSQTRHSPAPLHHVVNSQLNEAHFINVWGSGKLLDALPSLHSGNSNCPNRGFESASFISVFFWFFCLVDTTVPVNICLPCQTQQGIACGQ